MDEVYKYPGWSREIKLIYDDLEYLNVIFSSSSILEIDKAESDLSRRANTYVLKELSLREFIKFSHGIDLPSYSFENILEHHVDITKEVTSLAKPLAMYCDFVKYGAYPFFLEDIDSYKDKLLRVDHLIIKIDMPSIAPIDYLTVVKLKKLLKTIATSVPFTPNISKLARLLNLSRQSLLMAIQLLERVRLIMTIQKKAKGIGVLTKHDKIFLNNPNLLYSLGDQNVEVGPIRKTFIINQLENLHKINLSPSADFLIDDIYTLEVGGRNKMQKQISGIPNAYIAKDDIEVGIDNIIPLWIFGLMY